MKSRSPILMAYLLDANVFIAANNLHYGLARAMKHDTRISS